MPIYLDNAATSFPKPEAVYQAVDHFMRHIGASSGRGAYQKALEADMIVYQTRLALARLFNVPHPERIVFTSNITEALNLAMRGLLRPGDHVVTTSMEHNAVWRCLKHLEAERGVQITAVRCARDGTLDPNAVEQALRPNTRLIVALHASNVTGTLMPARELGEIARIHNVPFLLDTAQTAGVYPIDVRTLQVDLLAFTGHKGLLGPMGTGGLYIAESVEDLGLVPLKFGGTGGDSRLETQPPQLPERFEAGTMNVAGLAGLGVAVRFLLAESVAAVRAHEEQLTGYALRALARVPNLTLYGPRDPRRQVGVISFNLGRRQPGKVAEALDQDYDIMVRAGLHCAPQAHRTIGTLERGTVRMGLGYFNREAEIDQLVDALQEIASSHRRAAGRL